MAQTAFFKAMLKFCTTNKIQAKYFRLRVSLLANEYFSMLNVSQLDFLEQEDSPWDGCELTELWYLKNYVLNTYFSTAILQ